jgi:hypothetical protein
MDRNNNRENASAAQAPLVAGIVPTPLVRRFRPFSFFLIGIFIASVITINASRDVLANSSTVVYTYTSLFVFFLLASFYVSQYFSLAKNSVPIITMFITYSFSILVMLFGIYFQRLIKLDRNKVMNVILIFFIFFNALTIFYSGFFTPVTSKSDVWLQFIFFIPCMITDALKYIFHDLQNTTTMTYVLCLFEAVFVFMFFALPYILSNPSFSKRVSIVNSAVPLNVEYQAATSNLFHVASPNAKVSAAHWISSSSKPSSDSTPPPASVKTLLESWFRKINLFFTKWTSTGKMLDVPPPDTDIKFNKSYSVSLWAYVNPTPIHAEMRIFDYGIGKPSLTFTPVSDASNNKMGLYKAYFTNVNSDKHFVTFTLPHQKWNNYVFSYINGTCELYINGELFYTDNLGEDMPTYDIKDVMMVGQKNGLYGSICNVNYHQDPLSLREIITMYNFLSVRNPPVFTHLHSRSWTDYFNLHYILRK